MTFRTKVIAGAVSLGMVLVLILVLLPGGENGITPTTTPTTTTPTTTTPTTTTPTTTTPTTTTPTTTTPTTTTPTTTTPTTTTPTTTPTTTTPTTTTPTTTTPTTTPTTTTPTTTPTPTPPPASESYAGSLDELINFWQGEGHLEDLAGADRSAAIEEALLDEGMQSVSDALEAEGYTLNPEQAEVIRATFDDPEQPEVIIVSIPSPANPENSKATAIIAFPGEGAPLVMGYITNIGVIASDGSVVVQPSFFVRALHWVDGQLVWWQYWWYDSSNHPNWYYSWWYWHWWYYWDYGYSWYPWHTWFYSWFYWDYWWYWSTWWAF
jgi:hypothetical protein